MSFYVEVMCNERKPWPNTPAYAGKIVNRCLSDRGDNPQGRDLKSAAYAAREEGWIIRRPRYACCPPCSTVLPGEVAPSKAEG